MKNIILGLAAAIVFFIIVEHLDATSDPSMRVAAIISGLTSLYHFIAQFFGKE